MYFLRNAFRSALLHSGRKIVKCLCFLKRNLYGIRKYVVKVLDYITSNVHFKNNMAFKQFFRTYMVVLHVTASADPSDTH